MWMWRYAEKTSSAQESPPVLQATLHFGFQNYSKINYLPD
jgi:hypothetical protein